MATKLEKLYSRREKIKSILNVKDPLMKSFVGGRVGFKSGRSAKKHEAKIERELDLLRELSEIEQRIKILENPLKRTKAQEVPNSIFYIGEKADYCYNTIVEVIKINSKSVKIKYSGGFEENIKPQLLSKIK